MNKKLLFLLLTLLVGAAVVFFLLPSDEKKIRRNLNLLAEYSSSTSGEAAIGELQKAAMAGKLCSDPCRVHIESFAITHDFNKKELRDNLILMKKMLPHTTFKFHDTVVELTGNDRAEIVTTLSLSGKIADDRVTDAYELNVIATKTEGDWYFSAFTVVEFMEQ
ncbi:MAG: hypothetical protein K9K37_01415 [Desulfocapsa sp.]|nr:hypothetical protein [Desulfocapsa sp.]